MKLTEINLVPSHKYKRFVLSDFDIEHGTIFGYSEWGTIIIKAHMLSHSNIIIYALYDKTKQNFLSCVIGYDFIYQTVQYFIILDAFTPEKYQMQGFATALYVSLVKKYNIKLMSDKDHTPEGKKLWNNIGKVLNIKVWDALTDSIISKDKISDDDIYLHYPTRYLLIAEHISHGIELMGIKENYDGILDDRCVYTHKDYIGIYE